MANKDYQTGLSLFKEVVISDHYYKSLYDKVILDTSTKQNKDRAVVIYNAIFDDLVAILHKKSNSFVKQRVLSAQKRAKINWTLYELDKANQITPVHAITELMFDQQFCQVNQTHNCRKKIYQQILGQVEAQQPIDMVIVGLPFKVNTLYKTASAEPDLSEVNFLFELYEITKAIETLYKISTENKTLAIARFKVVCDGKRFHEIVNTELKQVDIYITKLNEVIKLLQLEKHIFLIDYVELYKKHLPLSIQKEKTALRHQAKLTYQKVLKKFEDHQNVATALAYAKKHDPVPEKSNQYGRFNSVFHALIFTMNYKCVERYAKHNQISKKAAYQIAISTIGKKNQDSALEHQLYTEAWNATIDYIAEIKSDRDLKQDPILMCLPHHIRWTIHAKSGQICLQTSRYKHNRFLPWHGVALIYQQKPNAIKITTLPKFILNNLNYIPCVCIRQPNLQLPFYVDKHLAEMDNENLLKIISEKLIRKRKI